MKKFLSVILALTVMAMMAVPAFATAKTNSEALSNPIQKKIAIAIVDGYDDSRNNSDEDPVGVATYAAERLAASDLNAATLVADVDAAVKAACSDLAGSWNSPFNTTKRDTLRATMVELLSQKLGITVTTTAATTTSATTESTTKKPPFTLPTLPPPMTDENGSTIKPTFPTIPTVTLPTDKDGNLTDKDGSTIFPTKKPAETTPDGSKVTVAPPDASAIQGKVQEVLGGIIGFFTGLFGGGGGAADPTAPTEPTEEETTIGDGAGDGEEIVDEVPQTGDIALYSVASVALVAGIALVLTKKKKD